MGDEKYYTVQLKGTAYRFAPLPADDVKRLLTAMHLNLTGARLIKALTRLLAVSAGEEQWGQITDRFMAKELELEEFTVRLFERLIRRQDKDGELAPDTASSELRSDDAE